MKLAPCLLAMMAMFPGCADKEDSTFGEKIAGDWLGSVRVFHDDARAVTCWVYADGYKGGISCIPDKELR